MAAIFPAQYVILDVETTGFKPELGHEIIEVAAQRVDGSLVVDQFQSLVRPHQKLDQESIGIHGLTDEVLAREGKDAAEIMPPFIEFLGQAVLIGHNIPFDLGFINVQLGKLGRPALTNQTLDTLELARRYLILPSYNLTAVAQYLKVPQTVAHRALADVETTHQVFLKLIERAKKFG